MEHSTFTFTYDELEVDLGQIEHVLGYGEGDDKAIVDTVLAEILAGKDLFSGIKAEYRVFDDLQFILQDHSLELNNVNFSINKLLFNQLKGSDAIAIFLCTAGKEIGNRSRSAMSEGDPLTGYIYDMIGTLIVDSAADKMQEILSGRSAEKGLKITNRYSPGYCGWAVAEQHKLFSLMSDNFCGIRITDSALMEPVKSVSGFIGIGEKVKYNKYTCSLCDMRNCTYREAPLRKNLK